MSIPNAQGQRTKKHKVFREFGGINTQPVRQAIDDNDFYWLENVQPIGFGNSKVVPQRSYLATLPQTAYYFSNYNINNTPYLVAACVDGVVRQINVNTGAITVIGSGFSTSNVSTAQWANQYLLIIDTTGYYTWDGTTLVNRSGVTGAPSTGTSIATYSGRVWITSGRTLSYSAPASVSDFQPASAGGSTTLTDETLVSNINGIISANNYLYVFGDDSINIIGDVRITTGTTTTTFSNVNISSSIGSNFPLSAESFYRSIWFANTSGVYSVYGATPRKASDKLDGIFQLIDFTKPITAGTVYLNNIYCYALCFTYNDPALGSRSLLALTSRDKWFLVSPVSYSTYNNTITFITTAVVAGKQNLYGTDGTNIFNMFNNTSLNMSWKMQTKLFDDSSPLIDKQVLKIGIEAILPGTTTTVLNVSIDTESSSSNYILGNQLALTFNNNFGTPLYFTNNSGTPLGWAATGPGWFKQDVSNIGKYFGATITSTTPQVTINNIAFQYELGAIW